MAYFTIYKSDGTAVNVNDNAIDNAYYNPTGGTTGTGLGVQLIGRNTIGNSAIIAQSLLQSTENFASSVIPSDATSLVGQLWFNKSTSTLNVKTSNAGSGATNWQQIVTVNSSGASSITGSLTVSGTVTASSFIGNATSATNIAGGAANSIPYQTGSGATTFLAQGTGVLQETAGAPIWTTTPTLTGTNFHSIPNSALTNSSLTIGSTNIALGASSTTLAGLTSVTSTTFIGALTGNASTATNVAYSGLTGTVPTWNQNTTGNAATATNATNATNATFATTAGEANTLNVSGTGSTFNWTGLGGQPSWLWGGNTPSTMDIYNPSNFSVNYANSAGSATNATNATNASYATNAGNASNGGVTSVNGLTGAVTVSAGGVGAGQTWTSYGRTLGSWYQNTTGQAISVQITCQCNADQTGSYFDIGSSTGSFYSMTVTSKGADYYQTGLIVPDSWYYRLRAFSTSPTIIQWIELS